MINSYYFFKSFADRVLAFLHDNFLLFCFRLPCFVLAPGSPDSLCPAASWSPWSSFFALEISYYDYGVRFPDVFLLHSERLTRFGRWLRHSSIDELPGLFNVLR